MNLTLGDEVLILLREYGPLTVNEIANYLGVNINEVKEELSYLELDRLVRRVKRGLLIKREAYDLTPTGLDEAERAYERLMAEVKEMINRVNNLNPEELRALVNQILNQYANVLPLILLLNLIPLELIALLGLTQLIINHPSW